MDEWTSAILERIVREGDMVDAEPRDSSTLRRHASPRTSSATTDICLVV